MMKLTLHLPLAFLRLLDRKQPWVLSSAGLEIRNTPYHTSFYAHTILREFSTYSKFTLKRGDIDAYSGDMDLPTGLLCRQIFTHPLRGGKK